MEEEIIIQRALEISKKEFKKYENKINPTHCFDHTERVFSLCKKILTFHKDADRLVVLVAAAFHDIGRIKDDYGRHEVWSKEITSNFFENDDKFKKIEEGRKEKILYIIEHHSDLDEKNTKGLKAQDEFKIVVDADRIDSFGPIGIIRASLDERYQKSAKEQLKHIKDKSEIDNFSLNSLGGQQIGEEFKMYLSEFMEKYERQEKIGEL